MNSTCPPGPTLLDLVGPERARAPADLVGHADACPSCAQELARLQQGFDALAGAEAAADPAALSRIEARLQGEAKRSSFRLGGLCALAGGLVLLIWTVLLGHEVTEIGPGLLLLGAAPLLSGAMPRSERRQALVLGVGALLVLLCVIMGIRDPAWQPLRGVGCLFALGGSGLAPAFLLSLRGRTGTWRRGALLGAAVCCVGLGLQTSLCGLGDIRHMLQLHLLPWLCGVAAYAALRQRPKLGRSAA